MAAAIGASIKRIALPAPDLLEGAAGNLVADLRQRLPDLRDAVVVLPDLHAASALACELSRAAGAPALLLPRITTLRLWAADVPLDKPVASHAARHAMLYRVLAERGWLPDADLWAVAAELGSLFDELTRRAVVLPDDVRAFTRQLEQAYRARAGAGFNFEASLVHELWHAAVRAGATLDPEAAYQLRLARLAERVSGPVYAIALDDLASSEQQFLEAAAARVPVRCFDTDAAAVDACSGALALAWPRGGGYADLMTRSAELRHAHPASPLAGCVKIFGAASAEQEAQAVDTTVREWLLQGKKSIAVVVNDRLTARRARALLERAQVLVEDEAGWAFSTTSAATAIGRWLDIAGNDAYYRDVLDLMKLPFAFFDRPRAARQAAVSRLERYARRESIVSGLDHFLSAARSNRDREVADMLERLDRGLVILGRGKRPIARWLTALVASLREIGIADGLAADAAGEQLLELLERLKQELMNEPLAVSFAEWRRWLARELETATFRDRAIESPVVFTHLGAAQLRCFDAALILGCDAAHLPGPDAVALFFNQGVRAELGLHTGADRVARIERQLAALLASSATVAVTWQRRTAGEPNLLSPQFERLGALHRLAYGTGLEDNALEQRLAGAEVRYAAATVEVPAGTAVPAPSIPASLVPEKISASAYNALMACPYQFHARHVLRLGELDDVQEEIEKKDYGQLVHLILSDFHGAHPRVLALDPATARRELEALSEAAFAESVARNYLARAWLTRWLALIPDYLDWQRKREQAGWSWHAGEVDRNVEITTPEGRRFVLRGRLDRVDENAQGAFAVIDYKTQRPELLRHKLESSGEDVQLPVYALLWGGPVAAALFLSMERGGIKEVPVGDALGVLAAASRERLGVLYDALHDGAPLTAQGIDAVCEYCEVRGLCRRNYW